jgi:hypothetical protein
MYYQISCENGRLWLKSLSYDAKSDTFKSVWTELRDRAAYFFQDQIKSYPWATRETYKDLKMHGINKDGSRADPISIYTALS